MRCKLTTQQIIIFSICFLANLPVGFSMTSPSVIGDKIALNVGKSREDVPLFSSLFSISFAFAAILFSPISDTINPGYVICISSMALSVSLISLAFSKNFYYTCAARIITGVSSSTTYVSVIKVLSNWFDSQTFCIINAFIHGSVYLGSLIAQAPLAYLVQTFHWTWCFVAFALFVAVIAVLSALFISEKPIDESGNFNGQVPNDERNCFFLTFNSFKTVLTKPDFWKLAVWLMFTHSFFLVFACYWCISYLRSMYRFELLTASSIALSLNISGIVFAPAVAFLSNYMHNRKWVLFGLTLGQLLGVITPVFFEKNTPAVALCTIFVVYGGTSVSSVSLCITQMIELIPSELRASAIGYTLCLPHILASIEGNLIRLFLEKADGGVFEFYSTKAYKLGLWPLGVTSIIIGLIIIPFFNVEESRLDKIKKTSSQLMNENEI